MAVVDLAASPPARGGRRTAATWAAGDSPWRILWHTYLGGIPRTVGEFVFSLHREGRVPSPLP
jgi:hypothetical protein